MADAPEFESLKVLRTAATGDQPEPADEPYRIPIIYSLERNVVWIGKVGGYHHEILAEWDADIGKDAVRGHAISDGRVEWYFTGEPRLGLNQYLLSHVVRVEGCDSFSFD
jgi:hypothetical protein